MAKCSGLNSTRLNYNLVNTTRAQQQWRCEPNFEADKCRTFKKRAIWWLQSSNGGPLAGCQPVLGAHYVARLGETPTFCKVFLVIGVMSDDENWQDIHVSCIHTESSLHIPPCSGRGSTARWWSPKVRCFVGFPILSHHSDSRAAPVKKICISVRFITDRFCLD